MLFIFCSNHFLKARTEICKSFVGFVWGYEDKKKILWLTDLYIRGRRPNLQYCWEKFRLCNHFDVDNLHIFGCMVASLLLKVRKSQKEFFCVQFSKKNTFRNVLLISASAPKKWSNKKLTYSNNFYTLNLPLFLFYQFLEAMAEIRIIASLFFWKI